MPSWKDTKMEGDRPHELHCNILPSLRVGPRQSIGELPGDIYLLLLKLLDMAQKWRQLVDVASKLHAKYNLRDYVIEGFAQQLYVADGSPSKELLKAYSVKGLTCQELAWILDEMQLERALQLLIEPEPLRIVCEPEAKLNVEEGETVILSCEAAGFPYPKYVWFCNNDQVSVTQDTGTLRLDCVKYEKSGEYICRVHNEEVLMRRAQPLWSQTCYVNVTSNPKARGQILAAELSAKVINPESYRAPPQITIHPRPQLLVFYEQDIKLTCYAVSASGDPLSYAWFKDGQPLTGQNHPELVICKAKLEHSGRYHCQVSQARGGAACSTDCYVEVLTEQLIHRLPPQIHSHPKRVDAVVGARVTFSVEAHGKLPMHYEWYHNGNLLRGQTDANCQLSKVSLEEAGKYQVRVTNDHGTVMSKEAHLGVTNHSAEYTAEDKVALLIGNSTYRSHSKLPGVENDILETKKKLEEMNFKVIALLDLTLEEMKTAVNIFYDLLDPGVYGLFYFAGHGFAHQGQHFCMPWDAHHGFELSECLCTEEVESGAQKKHPALFFMLLDMCRRAECCDHEKGCTVKQYHPHVYGNTCLWFATSSGQKAFEEHKDKCNGRPRGRFNKQLLKVLGLHMPLIPLYQAFREEFNKDPYHNDETCRQDPELRTNIKETHRTLMDRIVYDHNPEAMERRTKLWNKARVYPSCNYRLKFCISKEQEIKLYVKPYLSNMLDVYLSADCRYEVHLMKDPNLTALSHQPLASAKKEDRGYRFSNLQRLQGDLELKLKFQFKSAESEVVTINLNRPLISNLSYWKEQMQADMSRVDSSEQSDYTTSLDSTACSSISSSS